jgi:hypothetical protein
MEFRKVEQEQPEGEKIQISNGPKSVYTYAVEMIVSVFANDEDEARSLLDEKGGFVSHRVVELKDAVGIYTPDTK